MKTLADIGHEAGAALPAVMALVRSPSIGVRVLALEAAWAINGDRPPHLGEVLDALMMLAHDPASPTRTDAIRQLGASPPAWHPIGRSAAGPRPC